MGEKRLSRLAWALLIPVSVTASAQSPAPAPKNDGTPASSEVGGTVYSELIKLTNARLSTPLRYGSVKRGSEIVQIDGRTLARDRDYVIDYAAGTIFFKVQFRDGQNLQVSYRYDEAGKAGTFAMGTGAPQNGFNGWKFDFAPGASAFLGLGFTERTGDGTVLSSNVYGISNNFNIGNGSVKGLLMLGSRERSEGRNLMGANGTKANVEEGQGKALIQNLSTKFMGGTINANYQDIDTRFAGFQSFAGAGYNQAQIAQFAKERGLKRSGLSFNNIGSKDLNVSNGFATVGDDSGAITSRTTSLQGVNFNLSMWSQSVDKGFTRFQDIGAADWQMLAKERGLKRNGVSASFNLTPEKKGKDGKVISGPSKFTYNTLEVNSETGSLRRREMAYSSSLFAFDFNDSKVDETFARFGDVRPGEFNGPQLAQERGMVRQGFGFAVPSAANLNYRESVVRNDGSSFKSVDAGISTKNLTLEHSLRTSDKDFGRLGNIGEPEIQQNVAKIGQMVAPGSAVNPHDRNGFVGSAGVERSTWKLGYDIGRGAKAAIQKTKVKGENDEANVTAASLLTKNFNLRFRDQKTGQNFDEISRLMATEQIALGNQKGFNKQDIGLDAKLGGAKSLTFDQMRANDATGEAGRQALKFTDKNFNLNYIKRYADQGFVGLSTLADPERDYLRSIAGYSYSEGSVNWNILPNLQVSGQMYAAKNSAQAIDREMQRGELRWSPFKGTSLSVIRFDQVWADANQSLINQHQERYLLTQNFGKSGTLTLVNEIKQFDGNNENQPDSQTKGLIYETKINAQTGIRTEQTQTTFENGQKETTSSNTISTELNKRTGFSVTDTQIKRDGDLPDQTLRQYGVWYDFGKGIRLKYGYARNLAGEDNGTLNSGTEISGGTFQDVKFDGATYVRNGWDDKRDQHMGRVSLSNAKPLNWGFVNDVRFYYNADTARDFGSWQRENRSFGFGFSKGKMAFGFDYLSQIHPSGERAIDRVVSYTTDRTGKDKLQASFKYGVRTMPGATEGLMIRDYNITWKPSKDVNFVHQVVTNPLKQQNNALLGTLAQPFRTNVWQLSFEKDSHVKTGLFWKENIDEARHLMTREGGLDLRLFTNTPSPIRFSYGVAQTEVNGIRQTAHKFGLYYNQRPGPNQSWGMMIENLNWQHGRPAGSNLQNWNLRMDYSWRF